MKRLFLAATFAAAASLASAQTHTVVDYSKADLIRTSGAFVLNAAERM